MKPASVRAAFLAVLTTLGLALVLLFVHQLVLPLIACLVPKLATPVYDLAVYGAAPKEDYVSFNLTSPEASVLRWDDRCEDGLVFLTPSGPQCYIQDH